MSVVVVELPERVATTKSLGCLNMVFLTLGPKDPPASCKVTWRGSINIPSAVIIGVIVMVCVMAFFRWTWPMISRSPNKKIAH